jgi:glyoxylase-like metal-dependent hydrolase (beta-lactamase superfamily II)
MKHFSLALLLYIFHCNFCIGQSTEKALAIKPLCDNFYIYSTYNLYKEYKVSANGMYLVTDNGVVLFDTPWDTTQFQPLLDSIKLKHHKDVVLCIATHFHDDRTAGFEYYRSKGIKTYSTKLYQLYLLNSPKLFNKFTMVNADTT